ncbi:MAG TPA: hypothetical protein VGB55_11145 [Tepidisphaeraceae bacterium]|jgi:hypothetical protein
MAPFLWHLLFSMLIAFAFVYGLAMFLTLFGSKIGPAALRTPLLDVWVACFTIVPWAALSIAFGWGGFVGAIVGSLLALSVWSLTHEMMNPEAAKGPRIVKFINRTAGRLPNHLGLYGTLLALPVFWQIRLAELCVYWILPLLLRFPNYKQSEWVNVSRTKFGGLVGHDLIWCLYCDWMTGVYSLGAEMLRNVESYWCPIRFYDGKKCDNCKLDFPDLDNGWVPADGTMTDVVNVMEDKYTGPGERAWFGHPVRLTVKGHDTTAKSV